MKSELVVDVRQEEVSIALLEDSRLVSLQKESRNIAYAVGDIYLAKVKKIMPGLNAAFLYNQYQINKENYGCKTIVNKTNHYHSL